MRNNAILRHQNRLQNIFRFKIFRNSMKQLIHKRKIQYPISIITIIDFD